MIKNPKQIVSYCKGDRKNLKDVSQNIYTYPELYCSCIKTFLRVMKKLLQIPLSCSRFYVCILWVHTPTSSDQIKEIDYMVAIPWKRNFSDPEKVIKKGFDKGFYSFLS
jgi:hypothetical protein